MQSATRVLGIAIYCAQRVLSLHVSFCSHCALVIPVDLLSRRQNGSNENAGHTNAA